MVTLPCALSSLKSFILGFRSSESRPDRESRSLPPPKRAILPALHKFYFDGFTEYLEDLVTRIDAPQLDEMDITFLSQMDFDCPQLAQFIDCTPALRAFDKARVQFDDWTASVKFRRIYKSRPSNLIISIFRGEPNEQLSSIEQVCKSFSHLLSTVKDLYLEHLYSEQVEEEDSIENTLWLQLLLPFTAVKNLYLSYEFVPDILATLQEHNGIIEVLPSLQNTFGV